MTIGHLEADWLCQQKFSCHRPGNFFSHVDPFLLGEIELLAQCLGVLDFLLRLFERVWKISNYQIHTGICASLQNGSSIGEAEFRQRR